MEYVNIHINGVQVGTSVPFQRVPILDEHVAYQGQWYQVSWVAHDWLNGAPIAGIILVPSAHGLTASGAIAVTSDPTHPFPGGGAHQ